MLSDETGKTAAPLRALTHRDCLDAASKARGAAWVQVRQRIRGEPGCYLLHCGQVRELQVGEGQTEWFKVQTADGYRWAESRNVRLCSGDERCVCEQGTDAPQGRAC